MARFTRQARRNDNKIAGMYDLEERLGAGHFAEVKLARHVFTGERVAVKVIDKLKLDDTAKHHLYQEVRCMKLVQHPNIVRLYEVIDTNTKLYLVQEFGDGGDMYDYIMKHEQGLSEEKARRYFRQILQAIDYCHKLYVVHRDLKPENVIFFKKFDVAKLTDFGFSNKFMPGKKLETSCGSLAYSAPEILLGDSYDAPAVDVWSLGVILYMMVVGKAPFYEANESETLTMILDCKFHIPDHVSPACKSLISRMIVRDAVKRAKLVDIMNDPWILMDHGPLLVTTAPLVNQVRLSVDQHNEIVQKMLSGKIADQETIKKCLETGSYNHISATYYLLAEQVLRRLRWRSVSSSSLSKQSSENKSHSSERTNGVLSGTEKTPSSAAQENIADAAKPSVSENSVEVLPGEEPVNDEEPQLNDIDTNLVTNRLRYHSSESIYDQLKNDADNDEEAMVGAVSVKMSKKQRRTFQKQRVVGVKSTPAFLNQISEERESDLDDSPRASPRPRRLSRRPLDVLKAQQKSRRHSSNSGGRRSSVSSSSEDDADLDKKMRRLSTERCRRSPKRRSDDEGDGDDGESGAKSPRGVARKKKMSENSQSRFDDTSSSSESGNSINIQAKSSNVGFLCTVLNDNLVGVNLKLHEASESDPNLRKPNESPIVDTNNRSDAEKLVDLPCSHLENSEQSCKHNFNKSQLVTGSVMDLGGPEGIIGIVEDRHLEDRVLGGGTIENRIVEDRISNGATAEDRITNDGIIMKHEFTKDANVDDGVIRIGIVDVGIVDDEVSSDEVFCDGVSKVDVMGEVVEKKNLQGEVMRDGAMKDEMMKDKVVSEGFSTGGIIEHLQHQTTVFKILNDGVSTGRDRNGEIVDKGGNMNEETVDEGGNMDRGISEGGVMEIYPQHMCSEATRCDENASDRENVNISINEETFMDISERDGCTNRAIPPRVVLRGSDIEEIEMYMKAKDNGLELQSVGVRTIFHNRKVSRVTSNCCQII